MSLTFIPSLRLQRVHLPIRTFLLEHCSSFGHMFFSVPPANQQGSKLSYVAEISLPWSLHTKYMWCWASFEGLDTLTHVCYDVCYTVLLYLWHIVALSLVSILYVPSFNVAICMQFILSVNAFFLFFVFFTFCWYFYIQIWNNSLKLLRGDLFRELKYSLNSHVEACRHLWVYECDENYRWSACLLMNYYNSGSCISGIMTFSIIKAECILLVTLFFISINKAFLFTMFQRYIGG